MNSERLLQRFLRYVQVDTTAGDPQSRQYPSSLGQLDLGRMVRDELLEIGLADAVQDEFGIVTATVPSTTDKTVPAIALVSHLDTSPEMPGADVKPQVVRSYQGNDLALVGNPSQVIRVAENPELSKLVGSTLITTDGTTLLGADDKAGVAVIVEAAAHLVEHPEIAHGPLRLCFTCDEELGHGVDHLDLERLGAAVAYTFDGRGADEIDVATFSADAATVTIRGVNIHPSIAKGRMINAVRVAGEFISRLPRARLAPEAAEGRQGFVHPYQIEGGVAEAIVRLILRDFDARKLVRQAELLHRVAEACQKKYPRAEFDIQVTPQYRNLAEGLAKDRRAVNYAKEALRRLGRRPVLTRVRGGTDGSRLTELGLPTPNLSCGQHNPHSALEWACLEEMVAAAEVLVALAEVWSDAA